ncbi:MAG: hypothetical protein GF364_22010 [Candidatus Lokiarchaeota archaeon]|nr:hypothetical protein [Candidatus Lokiarchaeota archaeon]
MSKKSKSEQVFHLAKDGINPSGIPKKKLYNDAEIPAIGLGTFGSDHVSADQIADAVEGAISVGYRHIDCASVYGNQKEIGEKLKIVIDAGIERKSLWITSKLWNDKHAPQDVILACEKTLKDLKLDYLDLYLIHWPFPNHHPPGCDGDTRNPNAVPYKHESYMQTWYKMEELLDLGYVKNIGLTKWNGYDMR